MRKIRDLKAAYGAIEVVHGISLDVNEGKCVALIGANGAGKSSTLKAICGLIPVKGGTIGFEGRDITNLSGHAVVQAGITMCPRGPAGFPQMSTLKNLRMGACMRHDGEQAADIERMMDMYPILRDRAQQAAGALSGGKPEMMAIARAPMARPKLFIFDEPSPGLAPNIAAEVAVTIGRIKAMGKTILLVVQNLLMALRLADLANLFEAGEIVPSGTGEELQSHPEVVKAYLGH